MSSGATAPVFGRAEGKVHKEEKWEANETERGKKQNHPNYFMIIRT